METHQILSRYTTSRDINLVTCMMDSKMLFIMMYSRRTFRLTLSVAVRMISNKRRERFFTLTENKSHKTADVSFNRKLKKLLSHLDNLHSETCSGSQLNSVWFVQSLQWGYTLIDRDLLSFGTQLSQIQSVHQWHRSSYHQASSETQPLAMHIMSTGKCVRVCVCVCVCVCCVVLKVHTLLVSVIGMQCYLISYPHLYSTALYKCHITLVDLTQKNLHVGFVNYL